MERNREIIQRKQTTDFTVQDLQAKCVAYLLFIVKDWLPFIAHDEIVPFDKTYICETSKRSLVLLFEPVMYQVGVMCFESAYVFQVPSLFSLENWSQVGDCIIRVCFSYVFSSISNVNI